MKPLAIVTGATGGIGSAVSKRLARDGFDLVMIDHDEKRLGALQRTLVQEYSCATFPCQLNFAAQGFIKNLEQNTTIPWHRLRALVNCAGVAVGKDIFELSEDDWDLDIAINLKAPFLLTQFAVRHMKVHRSAGSIINISSLAGIVGAKKPNYASSKSGLLGLTKSVAMSTGAYGIRVNVIYPGAVDTPLIADWDQSKRDIIAKNTPLQRIARPEEVASIVSFLASDEASYVTAAAINATGGQYTGQ